MEQTVIVRFTKRYDCYNVGEIAGFPPRKAAWLAKMSGAEIIRPRDFNVEQTLEATRNQPNGPTEAEMLKRQGIIQTFSAVPDSEREADGRPKVEIVSALFGATVSAKELESAWKQYMAGQTWKSKAQRDAERAATAAAEEAVKSGMVAAATKAAADARRGQRV